PPVTKMNFVVTSRPPFLFGHAIEAAACPVHILGLPVSSVYADELRCHGAALIPTASPTGAPVFGSSRRGPIEGGEAASGTRPRGAPGAPRRARPSPPNRGGLLPPARPKNHGRGGRPWPPPRSHAPARTWGANARSVSASWLGRRQFGPSRRRARGPAVVAA